MIYDKRYICDLKIAQQHVLDNLKTIDPSTDNFFRLIFTLLNLNELIRDAENNVPDEPEENPQPDSGKIIHLIRTGIPEADSEPAPADAEPPEKPAPKPRARKKAEKTEDAVTEDADKPIEEADKPAEETPAPTETAATGLWNDRLKFRKYLGTVKLKHGVNIAKIIAGMGYTCFPDIPEARYEELYNAVNEEVE